MSIKDTPLYKWIYIGVSLLVRMLTFLAIWKASPPEKPVKSIVKLLSPQGREIQRWDEVDDVEWDDVSVDMTILGRKINIVYGSSVVVIEDIK